MLVRMPHTQDTAEQGMATWSSALASSAWGNLLGNKTKDVCANTSYPPSYIHRIDDPAHYNFCVVPGSGQL